MSERILPLPLPGADSCFLLRWLVKAGQRVSQAQPLAEYVLEPLQQKEDEMQDGSALDFPAPVLGKLPRHIFRSPRHGTVVSLKVEPYETERLEAERRGEMDALPTLSNTARLSLNSRCYIAPHTPILDMRVCAHPVVYQNLCASCGQDISKEAMQARRAKDERVGGVGMAAAAASSSYASSAMPSLPASSSLHSDELTDQQAIVLGGAHKTIHLSSSALRERVRSNTLDLLSHHKLLCVLDLDHTLLHATSDARVEHFVGREEDLFAFDLPVQPPPQPVSAPGMRPPPPPTAPALRTHFVKLRPGLSLFLDAVSRLFDLHVYTMGARAYADAVVTILDPEHHYVKQRIVSRDETMAGMTGAAANPALHAKSLRRIHPCDDGLVAIVDDRVDVWKEHAHNVIRAYEYIYFSGKGEMNARPQEHMKQQQGCKSGVVGSGVIKPTLAPIRSKQTIPPSHAPSTSSTTPHHPPAASSTSRSGQPLASASSSSSAAATTSSPDVPSAAASAPSSSSSSSSSSEPKIRRRKTASSSASRTPAIMSGPTHNPAIRIAGGKDAHARPQQRQSGLADRSQGSSANTAIAIDVDDGDEEKRMPTASNTKESWTAAATAMELDGEDVASTGDAQSSSSTSVDLTESDASSSIIPDLSSPLPPADAPELPKPTASSTPTATPSPYDAHASALPIFPYHFSSHPCPDNVLISLTAVLQAAHTLFYRQVDGEVKKRIQDDEVRQKGERMNGSATASPHNSILSSLLPLPFHLSVPRIFSLLKGTTLSGCVIVFSGVYPTEQLGNGPPPPPPQTSDAWIQATAFGATCLEDLPDTDEDGGDDTAMKTPRVTHVVAARDGSAKLRRASSMPADRRPLLVHVSWLWHSIAHFKKGDESKFPLWSEFNKQRQQEQEGEKKVKGAVEQSATHKETLSQPALTAQSVSDSSSAPSSTPTPPAASPSTSPSMSTSASSSASASATSTSSEPKIRRRKKQPPPTVPVIAMAGDKPPTSTSQTSSATPLSHTAPSSPSSSSASATPASSISSSSSPSVSTDVSPPSPTPTPGSMPPPASARVGLHLIHHTPHPPTHDELVQRVLKLLNTEQVERREAEEKANATQREEEEKARRLKRAASSRRTSGNTVPQATHPKGRRTVSWDLTDMVFEREAEDEAEAEADADADVGMGATNAAASAATVPLSNKRKASFAAQLDDLERIKRGRTSSSHTLRPTNVAPTQRDATDVNEDEEEDVEMDSEVDGLRLSPKRRSPRSTHRRRPPRPRGLSSKSSRVRLQQAPLAAFRDDDFDVDDDDGGNGDGSVSDDFDELDQLLEDQLHEAGDYGMEEGFQDDE